MCGGGGAEDSPEKAAWPGMPKYRAPSSASDCLYKDGDECKTANINIRPAQHVNTNPHPHPQACIPHKHNYKKKEIEGVSKLKL